MSTARRTAAPALLPAQRPLARWGVLRRARVTAGNGRLEVRTRFRTRSWTLGGGGVSGAVYVPGGPAGGRLHLCDAAGASLGCLAVADWLPDGRGGPVPPGTEPVTAATAAAGTFPELSGIAAFCRHAGLPVRAGGPAPAPARRDAGLLRPGPARPGSPVPVTASFALLLLTLLFTVVWTVVHPSPRGVYTPEREVVARVWASVLVVFSALHVAAAFGPALCGRWQWRRVRLSPELRPSPGAAATVTRAFARRARLGRSGDDLVLRTGWNGLRMVRGPADPVLGVRAAAVLLRRGRPWAVALVDGRETVRIVLPWDSWFAGDPALTRLRAFCDRTGISLREAEQPPPRGAPEPATDPTARPRGFRGTVRGGIAVPGGHEATGAVRRALPPLGVCGLGLLLTAPVLAAGTGDRTVLAVELAALALGTVPFLLLGGVRAWWQDRPAALPPVPRTPGQPEESEESEESEEMNRGRA
ncbi:hypothetical protein [Streptomyces aidingensis]|uniref:Uncharacterized protein n=1 Tax=Streptomyces aidingensis TaxID=910347 RepID=A0A1I1RCA3_9ACTN|nr:hypothetical protein [Streptomyces aidingensis]SFD29173.1 hypothetical protein SAMN05421773_112174 [Streptomyces aidingensis]